MNKVDDERRASTTSGRSCASGSVNRGRCRAIHGRLSGELLDVDRRSAARGPRRSAGRRCQRRGRGRARRRHLLGGDRRPPERRQVDAVQPARGRGTLGRARPCPGTTRDAIDTVVETEAARCGSSTPPACAARAKIDEPSRVLQPRARARGDRPRRRRLLVIDASEGVTHQDQRLAERVDASGSRGGARAQQVGPARRRGARKGDAGSVADMLGFLSYAPVLPISALSGRRVHHAAARVARGARRRTTRASRPRCSTGSCATRRPRTRRRS